MVNFTRFIAFYGVAIRNASEYAGLCIAEGRTWIYIESKGAHYSQTIVTSQETKQEVTADASSLKDEIDKTGRVVVYGIHFDTGDATIQSDSEDTLKQIRDLRQQNPELKLRVEDHTDNQGTGAGNQALSEKRAQAIVTWLVGQGIPESRLSAKGAQPEQARDRQLYGRRTNEESPCGISETIGAWDQPPAIDGTRRTRSPSFNAQASPPKKRMSSSFK